MSWRDVVVLASRSVARRPGRAALTVLAVALAAALRTLTAQDLVFPALHGPYGEDGRLQALLEWLGVPYVGNGVFASAAGMDKAMTKKLLAAEGLRVAEGVTLDGDLTLLDRLIDAFAPPSGARPAASLV